MIGPESSIETATDPRLLFKKASLELLQAQLAEKNYPGYPPFYNRLLIEQDDQLWEPPVVPYGPWDTSEGVIPTIPQRIDFTYRGLRLDTYGRPLHPWFNEMVTNPNIRALTGKGFYWNWGPNYTADPVIIRYDLEESHILLIKRTDTGAWALPGGFIDQGETGIQAAIREAKEETGLDFTQLINLAQTVYQGPVADLRTTGNAWAETNAVRIVLPECISNQLTEIQWDTPSEETSKAKWCPVSQINDNLFGSHKLLVNLAVEVE